MSRKAASADVMATRTAVSTSVGDLAAGPLVIVACSGGPDSLALAAAAAWVGERQGLDVRARRRRPRAPGGFRRRGPRRRRRLRRPRRPGGRRPRRGGLGRWTRGCRTHGPLRGARKPPRPSRARLPSCSATPSTTRRRRCSCGWPGDLAPGRCRRWPRAAACGAGPSSALLAGERPRRGPGGARAVGTTAVDGPAQRRPRLRPGARAVAARRTRRPTSGPGSCWAWPGRLSCCATTPTSWTPSPRPSTRGSSSSTRQGTGAPTAWRLAAMPSAVRTRVVRLMCLQRGSPAEALGLDHVRRVDALVSDWKGQGEVALPGGVTAGACVWKAVPAFERSTPEGVARGARGHLVGARARAADRGADPGSDCSSWRPRSTPTTPARTSSSSGCSRARSW